MQKNRFRIISILTIILFSTIIGLSSCSSTKTEIPTTAEGVYNEGLMLFKKEKWTEAQKMFDIVKLQYPATIYADDAQFYLAEINFKRKEYILAAFNYNMVRRIYNKSVYTKDALYKTALSYYQMSPSYDRDQENTLLAIQTFSEFMAIYPTDTLAKEAENKIIELREKLANKEFQSGEIYRKMENYKSAMIYYNAVIDNYSDTKVCEEAFISKMELLKETHKLDDLKVTKELFERTYPNTRFAKKYQAINN